MARPKLDKPRTRIRRVAVEEDAVHGVGTWKIAYADFVTAMMAFFLLLWLVNVTTPEQRDGIADYFNPINVSTSNSGADGQLAGKSMATDGALTSSAASAYESIPSARVPTLSPPGPDVVAKDAAKTPSDAKPALAQGPSTGDKGDLSLGEVKSGDVAASQAMDPALAERLAQVAAEERSFDRVEEIVRLALSGEGLADLGDNLLFERTAEGLRIQLTDRPHFSMFEVGSVEVNPRAAGLLRIVAQALAGVPNRVAVAGHTDGRGFAGTARYTNWELSSDRANAARRVLLSGGIPVARLARVEGLADTLHLYPETPEDPRNRRISITVLRRVALPGGG